MHRRVLALCLEAGDAVAHFVADGEGGLSGNVILVAEVIIERALGHTRVRNNLVHGHFAEAVLAEKLLGGSQKSLAVRRSAKASVSGCRCHERNIAKR